MTAHLKAPALKYVSIEADSRCNQACAFCPVSLRPRPAGREADWFEVRLPDVDSRLRQTLWLEISRSPTGVPAAAVRLNEGMTGSWRLDEIMEQCVGPGVYSLSVVDAGGKDVDGVTVRWPGTGGAKHD